MLQMLCYGGKRSFQCIMVIFRIKLLLLILSMSKVSEAQTVSLQLCSPPTKGNACQMSCTTPDQTQDIIFRSNNNQRGSCVIALGSPLCGTNTAQPSATVTTFDIASLSRSTDDGDWTCTYGSAPGVTDTKTLTVLTYPSTPSSSNITHTNGMTTTLRVSSEQRIDLTFVMDCTYPEPTVTWNFKECSAGSTLASKNGDVSEDTSASNICGSNEKNYISTTTFSSSDISNSDGQCVRPELDIKVGGFTAYTVEADFTMTVPESGLGPGAIAGIVIAVCVVVIAPVVIVILWKKKLLCFKVPTEKKPTGSTDSGIRSTSPNQVKPSVENSTPMVESSNVTNSKVDATENSKDPILDIENKKRHTGVDPLTERSEGQPEINKNKPLPSIGQ